MEDIQIIDSSCYRDGACINVEDWKRLFCIMRESMIPICDQLYAKGKK